MKLRRYPEDDVSAGFLIKRAMYISSITAEAVWTGFNIPACVAYVFSRRVVVVRSEGMLDIRSLVSWVMCHYLGIGCLALSFIFRLVNATLDLQN